MQNRNPHLVFRENPRNYTNKLMYFIGFHREKVGNQQQEHDRTYYHLETLNRQQNPTFLCLEKSDEIVHFDSTHWRFISTNKHLARAFIYSVTTCITLELITFQANQGAERKVCCMLA